jgi:hypothetical protein
MSGASGGLVTAHDHRSRPAGRIVRDRGRRAVLVRETYGTPVSKISELTLDDVDTTATRTTIKLGDPPASVP